jgi:hypothetical protein
MFLGMFVGMFFGVFVGIFVGILKIISLTPYPISTKFGVLTIQNPTKNIDYKRIFSFESIGVSFSKNVSYYSKCLVTSNKAKSNLGCAEEKFQTRGWVLG